MHAYIALALVSVVAAGPHGSRQRRHHARDFPALVDTLAGRSDDTLQLSERGCTDGSWQCVGAELQQCDRSAWVSMSNCTVEGTVCSATSPFVGCLWSWAVGGANATAPTPSAAPATAPATQATASAPSASSAIASGVSSSTGVVYTDILLAGGSAGASAGGNGPNGNAPTQSGYIQGTAAASSAPSPGQTGGGNHKPPTTKYSAPHYVIYADAWLKDMPPATDLSNYNRFILAFWLSSGPADNGVGWQQRDPSERQKILDEYHAAGIALMIAAFGSSESPTSSGADPAQTAQKLAAWVKQYGLDGVDIDYEDFNAMNSGKAEAWLITFQKELRNQLPEPYIISHAPVAPWFTSSSTYPSGGYVNVHKQVGDGISFYNIQYYNQRLGSDNYVDCTSLITSCSTFPGTSVMELNSHAGVPLDKIVIGKPLGPPDMTNGGYVDASLLATCVAQGKSQGWNGGVMFWQWHSSSANAIMGTVRG